MKTTSKLMTAVIIVATAIASQASASSLGQQRLAERNAAYFEQMGHKGSSGQIAQNSDYDFAVTPQQRMAKRSAAYWAGKSSATTESQQFPASRAVESTHPTRR
mgnify:CR=1 FL=1